LILDDFKYIFGYKLKTNVIPIVPEHYWTETLEHAFVEMKVLSFEG